MSKFADIIFLNADPLTVRVLKLKDIRGLVTLVGGRTAYCADGMGHCARNPFEHEMGALMKQSI